MAGGDGAVSLWEPATGEKRATLTGDASATSLAWTPGDRILIIGWADKAVRLWDVTTVGSSQGIPHIATAVSPNPQRGISLRLQTDLIFGIAFAPDGKTLATAGGLQGQRPEVKLWDPRTGKQRAALGGHKDSVMSVAFAPDGRLLATASLDGTVRLWEALGGHERATLKGHAGHVFCVAFSPDGKTLASAGQDTAVRLWDVAMGRVRSVLQGHAAAVQSATFAPDGNTLATGIFDGTVKLWDLAAGHERTTLRGHVMTVMGVALAPGARTLATASIDGTVKLWDMETRQEGIGPGPGDPDHSGRTQAALRTKSRSVACQTPPARRGLEEHGRRHATRTQGFRRHTEPVGPLATSGLGPSSGLRTISPSIYRVGPRADRLGAHSRGPSLLCGRRGVCTRYGPLRGNRLGVTTDGEGPEEVCLHLCRPSLARRRSRKRRLARRVFRHFRRAGTTSSRECRCPPRSPSPGHDPRRPTGSSGGPQCLGLSLCLLLDLDEDAFRLGGLLATGPRDHPPGRLRQILLSADASGRAG